jgi:hypothetical protein
MKGKAADRKGMGMELALLVLFVVFACSTLLVSVALLGKDNIVRQETQLRQQLAVDRLAEDILAGKTPDGNVFADYAAFKWNGSAWIAKLNGDGIDTFPEVTGNNVLLITDRAGAPLLTVALEGGKIIRWSHH